MKRAWLLAALLLRGFQAAQAAELACKPIEGLDALLKPGAVLLLGEMHGTAESPGFTAEAACAAVKAGRPVTVALELPATDADRLTAFLASEGTEKDRAAFLESPFWQSAYQDGRASRSRLDLLERVRALRRAGHPVKVTFFDVNEYNADRDRRMAENLKTAVEAAPGDVFLVLVGNIHSRLAKGVPWNAEFEPMGVFFTRMKPELKVTALDMAYAPGSAWICEGAEPSTCQVKALNGKGDERSTGRVELFPVRDERGYDGVYQVGPLTASLPAVRPGS